MEGYHNRQGCRCFTVAISGIDAAGKGYVSRKLYQELTAQGFNVALVNVDPWQNPQPVRLQKNNAAENFYQNVFRWDDLFHQLVFPLQRDKSISLQTTGILTSSDEYYPLIYDLKDIDILLLEGIFLFKRKYLVHYDFTVWVDCSFERGLQRAIERNAENLDEKDLIYDYQTFYYPAQQHHFKMDAPMENAGLVIDNN